MPITWRPLKVADGRLLGVVREMLFINGKFPGPLIEVNRGDRLVVNVTNQLSKNATTIHWHGLFQNGTNWFDGTTGECAVLLVLARLLTRRQG